jgi:tetratricopeptide (TPR) repeat protein
LCNIKGLLYFDQSYFQDAIQFFEQAIRSTNPTDDTSALNNIGRTYNKMKNFDKAEKYYLESLAKNPNNTTTLHNLAQQYREDLGNYELALSCYKKIVELNPNDWESWINMSVCEFRRNNFDKAIEYLEKARPLVNANKAEEIEEKIFLCKMLLSKK